MGYLQNNLTTEFIFVYASLLLIQTYITLNFENKGIGGGERQSLSNVLREHIARLVSDSTIAYYLSHSMHAFIMINLQLL